MKFLPLILATFMRHRGRTIFTWLSVVVAFILFSVLAAVRYGMLGQLTISVAERLDTYNMAVQGDALPLSYYSKITSVPGVVVSTYMNGFPGYYRRRQNALQVLAASPTVFDVFPEAKIPASELNAWKIDRQGLIVGSALAARFGWKVGETIPIRSNVPRKDGDTTWYFHLDGIYHANLPSAYRNFFIAHYQYFNNEVADSRLRDKVFQYTERIDDPREVVKISDAIDKLFVHSSPQTLTQSEVQGAVNEVRQFGNISAIVIDVGTAVFFSLLLIVGNTIAQSVRERNVEFAVFRAIGFRRFSLAILVLKESVILLMSGSIAGLVIGWMITRGLYPSVGNVLQTFQLTWSAAVTGVLLSVALGIAVVLLPLRRISRLQVAAALRGG